MTDDEKTYLSSDSLIIIITHALISDRSRTMNIHHPQVRGVLANVWINERVQCCDYVHVCVCARAGVRLLIDKR